MKHDEFIAIFRQCNVEISNIYTYIDKQQFYSLLIAIGNVVGYMRALAEALEPHTKGFKAVKSVLKKEE